VQKPQITQEWLNLAHDLDFLLAELDRLRAEVERLTHAVPASSADLYAFQERAQRAEVERLTEVGRAMGVGMREKHAALKDDADRLAEALGGMLAMHGGDDCMFCEDANVALRQHEEQR